MLSPATMLIHFVAYSSSHLIAGDQWIYNIYAIYNVSTPVDIYDI